MWPPLVLRDRRYCATRGPVPATQSPDINLNIRFETEEARRYNAPTHSVCTLVYRSLLCPTHSLCTAPYRPPPCPTHSQYCPARAALHAPARRYARCYARRYALGAVLSVHTVWGGQPVGGVPRVRVAAASAAVCGAQD
eukprot:1034635-Rhodomonas_salina.1